MEEIFFSQILGLVHFPTLAFHHIVSRHHTAIRCPTPVEVPHLPARSVVIRRYGCMSIGSMVLDVDPWLRTRRTTYTMDRTSALNLRPLKLRCVEVEKDAGRGRRI